MAAFKIDADLSSVPLTGFFTNFACVPVPPMGRLAEKECAAVAKTNAFQYPPYANAIRAKTLDSEEGAWIMSETKPFKMIGDRPAIFIYRYIRDLAKTSDFVEPICVLDEASAPKAYGLYVKKSGYVFRDEKLDVGFDETRQVRVKMQIDDKYRISPEMNEDWFVSTRRELHLEHKGDVWVGEAESASL